MGQQQQQPRYHRLCRLQEMVGGNNLSATVCPARLR